MKLLKKCERNNKKILEKSEINVYNENKFSTTKKKGKSYV